MQSHKSLLRGTESNMENYEAYDETEVGEQHQKRTKMPATSGNQSQKRNYQACIPCRNKKVKCDLGDDVENPEEPPCSRCRRENKECYFSAKRRRVSGVSSDGEEEAESQLVRSHPLPRPPNQVPKRSAEDGRIDRRITATLQHTIISGNHDALHLLAEAADTERPRADNGGSFGEHHETPLPSAQRPTQPSKISLSHLLNEEGDLPHYHPRRTNLPDTINAPANNEPQVYQSPDEAWSNYALVKEGWFTPAEAISFVDYYYRHLDPMTPIKIPNYHHPENHGAMINNEPTLTLTILMIASRFVKPNTQVADTRMLLVHDHLWKTLGAHLHQLTWIGDVAADYPKGNPGPSNVVGVGPSGHDYRMSSPSLGSIESLLLLMEWHSKTFAITMRKASSPGTGVNTTDTVAGWQNSIHASDRMSWKFLSDAVLIAEEHNVFWEEDEEEFANIRPPATDLSYHTRKEKLRRLLFIYGTQLSDRLRRRSIVPVCPRDRPMFTPEFLEMANQATRPLEATNLQMLDPDGPMAQKEFQDDLVLWLWCAITDIARRANAVLYFTRKSSRDLIEKGKYQVVMQQFEPELLVFHNRLDGCRSLPPQMRLLLDIELSSVRAFINQLALNAIIGRCVSNTPMPTSRFGRKEAIPLDVVSRWLEADRPFVKDITQSSEILLSAVMALHNSGGIKHATVRTYLKITCTTVMQLKTFVCGADNESTNNTFYLIQQAARALQTDIVDDVHVGIAVGTLLEALGKRVRKSLVQGIVRDPRTFGGRFASSRILWFLGSVDKKGHPATTSSSYINTAEQTPTRYQQGFHPWEHAQAPMGGNVGDYAAFGPVDAATYAEYPFAGDLDPVYPTYAGRDLWGGGGPGFGWFQQQ